MGEEKPVKEYSGKPFWPHQLLAEGGVMLLILALLFFLAAILPASLGEKADPLETVHPIYPEWYFLPLYGFIRLWSWSIGPIQAKQIGVVVPLIVLSMILFLPFYDKWNRGSGEGDMKHIMRRKKGALLGILLIVVTIVMAAVAVLLEKA